MTEPAPEELALLRNEQDFDTAPAPKPLERQLRKEAAPVFRPMPYSEIAEKALLCSFGMSPVEAGSILTEAGIKPEMFYHPGHSLLFTALIGMWDEQPASIDMVTVMARLLREGTLQQCGGAAYVSEVLTFIPTATNVSHYADTVKEKWIARQLIEVCTQQATKAYEETEGPLDVLEESERRVLGIRDQVSTATIYTARIVVMESMQEIQEAVERKGSMIGLPTGFSEIDQAILGLAAPDFIVVAARPGHGKSAFAMNVVEHIAIELRRPVGVFSLEMSRQQLVKRMIAGRARVNLRRVLAGYENGEAIPAMNRAAARIAAAPIFFDDQPDLSIQEVRARARRMKAKHGIEALFVDYLQLLRSNTRRREHNRALEVSEVSAGLKAIAKELRIPVVALAQITRQFEGRQNFRPRLSDLRESGSIEQDADIVAFIVREEMLLEREQDRLAKKGQAEFIIAKQRQGPCCDIPLTFLEEFVRFETRADFQPQQEFAI